MKNKLLLSFFLLFSACIAYAEPIPSEEYNFLLGWNPSQLPTDIDPRQSPDMCNCVSEPIGAASIRRGSERFIDQAVSSYPVKSINKIYVTTSAETSVPVLLATNYNKLLYSTGGAVPVWKTLISTLTPYADWQWLTYFDETSNYQKAVGIGGLNNNILLFDPVTKEIRNLFSTDPSSNAVLMKAKYGVMSKNYLVLGNVVISTYSNPLTKDTTYYPTRTYYSYLNKPSSMTWNRWIDFPGERAEEITGLGALNDRIDVFRGSSISDIEFTVLNLTALGGDWSTGEIVPEFGLRASRSLAKVGGFYVLAADDGIRMWDGGRRDRLQVTESSRLISGDIKVLLDKLIRNGTYKDVVGVYYPKKEWYLLSYKDPGKEPEDANNSVVVYDFKTGQWYPFCGLNVESWEVLGGEGDNGELMYGDSKDSYVYYLDKEQLSNDARKEIVIDVMDSTWSWTSSAQDTTYVKEGTASLKIYTSPSVAESSMTIIKAFNFGEWYDREKITRDDKLYFQAYVSSFQNISSLRIDLEANYVTSAFDTNFTSVTLTSASFTGGNYGWTDFEIALSSFPIRPDWTDLETETLPFANTLFFYGIRFVLEGIHYSSVSVDNIRIVQATENPVNFWRFTKMYDLDSKNEKNFGQMELTYEKSPSASVNVDVYNDFGSKSRTETLKADIPKEIILTSSVNIISILDSVDYSVKRSTVLPLDDYIFYQGWANSDDIIVGDRKNDRMLKLDRDDLTVIKSTYGSIGSGTTNYNLVQQMCGTPDYLFTVDMVNQRIKQENLDDYSFVQSFGSLGTGTTNLHQPSGLTNDQGSLWVSDEGNYKLKIINFSSMGFVLQSDIGYNTVADASMKVNEKYLFNCYVKVSETDAEYSDVILEKRDKNDLSLIDRVVVKPDGVTTQNAYEHTGDIALLGRFIYIPFVDDADTPSTYYVQKRLIDDFSIVSETSYTDEIHSLMGDPYPYLPRTTSKRIPMSTDGDFIQLKYYSDSLDNDFTLYNQTFYYTQKGQSY